MSAELSQEAQVGFIKAGAAKWFREHNVRPQTAEYVFNRYLQKCAQKTAQAVPSAKVLKLAAALRPVVANLATA